MNSRKNLRTLFFAIAASAALGVGAAPAFAGVCPAADVGVNVRAPGPTTPSGVSDTVISSIDLSSYNIPGRLFRLRRLVIQPGGIVPWHSHAERPANIYVLSGEITEYSSTCKTPILHRAGDALAESGNLTHWWRNNSHHVAVLLSADVLAPQMSPNQPM